MRTLMEEFILELFKKKDKNMADDEVFAEIKKVYDEKGAERNEAISRFGSEMKKKKEGRHEKEYKEFIESKEVKEAKLTGGI